MGKSLVVRHAFSLASLIPEPVFYLNQITTRFGYVDQKRTDQVSGYMYTVTNTDSFDQISIFVEGTKPLLTAEELVALQNAGKKVFVEFENAIVKPYYSERSKSIEDSIKADSISLVESK